MGHSLEVVRVVGGGSQNRLLNQLTADACACPVVAEPVEATALGNVLMQALASGHLSSLAEGRAAGGGLDGAGALRTAPRPRAGRRLCPLRGAARLALRAF